MYLSPGRIIYNLCLRRFAESERVWRLLEHEGDVSIHSIILMMKLLITSLTRRLIGRNFLNIGCKNA